MNRWLLFLLCLFVCQHDRAQQAQPGKPGPNCTLITSYGNDGRLVKSTPPQRVDSTADDKTTLSVLTSATNNYISVTYTPKTSAKTIQGELTMRFEDNSQLLFPMGQFNVIKSPTGDSYNCIYIILDKYIGHLQNKNVSNVIFKFEDGSFKDLKMKSFNTLIKDGITCLAPVYY